MNNSQLKKVRLKVHGMHCASCEVLIEQKFKNVLGIEKVQINHSTGIATLICSREPNIQKLNNLVSKEGYHVSSWQDRDEKIPTIITQKNTAIDYLQMGWIFLVIVSIYFILKQFDFLPSISINENMSYGLIFLIGLVAAVSSCIAVVGGLLLALSEKYNQSHPNLTGIEKFKPHIYFNIGRVLGYTVFGALVGALGGVFTLSPRTNGLLMVFVSMVMLMLGFQLLRLFPQLQRFAPRMPKFISRKIHSLSEKDNKGAPITLGALTFFLPCGFTQALQLYVLASGDWKVGALTMLVFSLGTLPALVSLSAVSSFAKGVFQKYFLKFAGVLVVMLALFNINNGLTLAGYNFDNVSIFNSKSNKLEKTNPTKAQIVNGKQIVKMKANGYTYTPNKFTIVEGIPVEWQVDGRGAAGCGKVIVMPSLGLSKYLSQDGITTIEFTPTQTGTIPFNCSMGMMTRGSEFTVIPNTTGIVGANTETPTVTETPVCDPSVSKCPDTQKINIEVSQERGIYPRSQTAKKGVPIELTIDNKIALRGCMSIWVIPKYNITIPMKIAVMKNTFTPIEAGVIDITCSMGSKMAEIVITD